MSNIHPNDRDPRDPVGIDPLDPAAPRTTYAEPRDPRVVNTHVDARSGGGRTGLAVAAVLAALLVIGFIAFSGPGEGVDPNTTATPSATEQVVPSATPTAPSADQAAPAENAAPAAPMESAPVEDEAPAATEQPSAPAPAQ